MKVYRQGDVIIKPATLPNELKEKKDNVLAEGAVSGHSHRIKPEHKSNAKLFVTPQGLMFIHIKEPTHIVHEEHEDIILPVGEYEVLVQREYNWFNEEVRRVAD